MPINQTTFSFSQPFWKTHFGFAVLRSGRVIDMAAAPAAFGLQLEPAEKVQFACKKLGEEPITQTIKITNPLKERVAFKVKCTSNEMFRIRPPVGALKTDEKATVSVTFNAGKSVPDNGKHYFAVYYLKAADEKKAPRQVWADHKGDPEGTKRIYVDFKKEDGGAEEKKEEKKEEEKKEEKKEEEKKEEKKEEEKKEEKKEEEKKEEEKKEEKKEEEKKEEKKEEEKKE